jgi:outer membrane protein TolC
MLRILLTSLILVCCGNNSYALSVSEYLDQVRTQNLNYNAAAQNADAYELLKKKANLVTAVKLYGYSEKSFTEQNQALQIVRYTQVNYQKNQIGFSQTSDFGLNTNLYYSLNNTKYHGLNASNYTNPSLAIENYQSIPTLELTLSLWQNRFGASTKATKDSTYFANESQKLTAKALSLTELTNSEKAYWMLVYTRKAVEIQRRALEGAKKILDYVTKRERMNLGDKSDVLQARASFESRHLFLKQAENDEKIAIKNFNKQRNVDLDQIPEKLDDFDLKKLQTLLVPTIKAADRFDVKASEATMKAAVAAAKLEEENNKPSLNLYGSHSVTQIKDTPYKAAYNSFAPNGIGSKIGVQFSMPINFGLTSDIREGAVKSASAAKITYRQRMLEQENDWQSLVQNMTSYKENLKLSLAIEAAQKLKLENERILLKQGRTTTYQVLLFEQDFSNSALATQQLAYRLLEAIANSRLYQN